MKFRAALFDLDGTLLDTLADLADSMNAVLERNRLPSHELAAYRYFVGEGIDMLVRRALPFEVADEAEFQRFVREMKKEYSQRWLNKTRPYPGIPAMLDAFAAAGLELAVLSNKPQDATAQLIAALLPGCAFRVVQGASPAKPKKSDPAAAIEIAAHLSLAPQDFLFIGDTAIDMQTARAAGMFPVGVLWGFRPATELIAAGAKMLVAAAENLVPWLRS